MVQHGEALTRASGDPSLKEAVVSGRFEELSTRMRTLCEHALKLTLAPMQMSEDDIIVLRDAGFDDRAIVDANQVIAYYNYVNRVADGLGVELEERWPVDVRRKRKYPLREIYLGSP